MPRVLISPDDVQGQRLTVRDPQELHHLVDVLRVKVGDPLECFDGQGRAYAGLISRCARGGIVVEIREEVPQARQPALSLRLAQALIKPERFEWALQKATELGVSRLSPVLTQRTITRLRAEQGQGKLARWQRIVQEAATQCGRTTVPQLDSPQPFSQFVPRLDPRALILMPTLAVSARPLREAAAGFSQGTPAIVLIGPEGDFTPEEVALAQQHGARPVSLGSLTLRSETAAVAVLSILRYVGEGF